ncbi:hypothetical protein AD953_04950 [Acetobacter malorum]|uniref:Secreted protein n=1 Tax=Acetobacter malorum TaxID=178901 RepID=A0A149V9Y7_9PROT|nr:hypothetical protein AD953_04950 [Acetobacter malorum]
MPPLFAPLPILTVTGFYRASAATPAPAQAAAQATPTSGSPKGAGRIFFPRATLTAKTGRQGQHCVTGLTESNIVTPHSLDASAAAP